MSKERTTRKLTLNKRVQTKKGVSCKYCTSNKMHTDGSREWCTKCKREN